MLKIGLREVLFLVILGLAGAFIVAQGAEKQTEEKPRIETKSSVSIVVAGEDGEVIMDTGDHAIDPVEILDMLPEGIGEMVESAVGQALIVADEAPVRGDLRGDGNRDNPKQDDERNDRRRKYMESMRKRMEEMQKRREESFRKRLGATEEEWKVLYPRIKKVQDIQSSSRTSMYGGMMVRRYGQRSSSRELTDTQKALKELSDLMKKDDPNKADIKAALEKLRDAKKQNAVKLADARKELREIITVKQEAILVQMRILD